VQQRPVQGCRVRETGLHRHGCEAKTSRQAAGKAIPEKVELTRIVDELAKSDHPSSGKHWAEKLEILTCSRPRRGQLSGVFPSPLGEARVRVCVLGMSGHRDVTGQQQGD
jgi:hypothetical protein